MVGFLILFVCGCVDFAVVDLELVGVVFWWEPLVACFRLWGSIRVWEACALRGLFDFAFCW